VREVAEVEALAGEQDVDEGHETHERDEDRDAPCRTPPAVTAAPQPLLRPNYQDRSRISLELACPSSRPSALPPPLDFANGADRVAEATFVRFSDRCAGGP
jgi:hypothetical protein